MTLGTGIFLSTCLLAPLILFLATKDRWRWGRLLVLTGVVGLGLVGIGTAIYFGVGKWQRRPVILTELEGISLGDSEGDVTFKKGTERVPKTGPGGVLVFGLV